MHDPSDLGGIGRRHARLQDRVNGFFVIPQPVDSVCRPLDEFTPSSYVHAQLDVCWQRIIEAHERPPEEELHRYVSEMQQSTTHVAVLVRMLQLGR